MAALKDQWNAQRRQRQAEVAQRQQDVRQTLDSLQLERQVMSALMREELSAFQQALQQDTQQFLAQAYEQRLANAKAMSAALQAYKAALQEEMSQFLSLTTAERSLMAQELFQGLERFHAELSTSVADLRLALQRRMQELQLEVQMLQADTQEMLDNYKAKRLADQEQLLQELAAYAEALRGDVQSYLSALEVLRGDRAAALWQMLQQSRADREAEMDALMAELADFRAYLKDYRTNLYELVWGNGDVEPPPEPPRPTRTVAAPAPPAPPVAARRPAPSLAKPVTPVKRPGSLPVTPVAAQPPASPEAKPAPMPVAPDPEPEPEAEPATGTESISPPEAMPAVAEPAAAIAPAPAPAPAPTPTPEPEPQPTPAPASVAPPARNTELLETEIFEYIKGLRGARLSEIESALSINRFQAVDALRSLIKKGSVTQRDRVYLIPEEISL